MGNSEIFDTLKEFYVEQNKNINCFMHKKKGKVLLNESFFTHPYEVIFRSFSDICNSVLLFSISG